MKKNLFALLFVAALLAAAPFLQRTRAQSMTAPSGSAGGGA